MKIRIVGGGPAGLYFAILMKQAYADWDVVVHERGPRDATWGFGVVFSDRALEFLSADDPGMYDYLTPAMQTWNDLTIVHSGVRIPIGGNGFASIGRLRLLNLLHERALAHGVRIAFESDVTSLAQLGPADLVVAADGAFSWLRQAHEAAFGTRVQWGTNPFVWYGTTRPFDTLTLTFRTSEHGVFCAHHYRYAPDMSTFLVETDAATFERAGFDSMDEAATLRYCERVFAPDLDGHPLLSNRSHWRRFPAVWNTRWSTPLPDGGRLVLLGDALRTAHFSIGSGTRLAMEDALALGTAIAAHPGRLDDALAQFQAVREPPMKKLWDAANVSLRWYETMGDLMALDPYEFAYRYMTRSGRVDHANLKRRDPVLAAAYEKLHPEIDFGAGAGR